MGHIQDSFKNLHYLFDRFSNHYNVQRIKSIMGVSLVKSMRFGDHRG